MSCVDTHSNFLGGGGGGRGVTYVTRFGKACLKVIFSTFSSFFLMTYEKIEPFKFHNNYVV